MSYLVYLNNFEIVLLQAVAMLSRTSVTHFKTHIPFVGGQRYPLYTDRGGIELILD